jgi:hypothetical protein
LLATCIMLLVCLAYSTMTPKATCSSETTVDFQRNVLHCTWKTETFLSSELTRVEKSMLRHIRNKRYSFEKLGWSHFNKRQLRRYTCINLGMTSNPLWSSLM